MTFWTRLLLAATTTDALKMAFSSTGVELEVKTKQWSHLQHTNWSPGDQIVQTYKYKLFYFIVELVRYPQQCGTMAHKHTGVTARAWNYY